MKKLRKRIVSLALCVLVLMAAAPVAHGATVYFVALNSTLLPLEDGTMPTVVNGVLYVPYTVLSANATGVNMGVYATYNSVKNRVLVYSSQEQLIFDLQADQTYDADGVTYPERAIMRNSTVYLPVAMVCQVFDELEFTLNSTAYGYLVRIKTSTVTLGDSAFIDAAGSMMKSALKRYEAEHPERPAGPTVQPSTTPAPVGSGAGVYLAFTPEAENVDQVLSALDGVDSQGLFFLTAAQLEQWDGLVRRLLGEGHFIGLRLEQPEYESALEELERGRAALAAAAHCRAAVVLAEGLDEAGCEMLEQLGYVCWQSTADGRALEGSSASRASALMREMTGGESARNYLLLDDGYGSVLGEVLWALSDEDYQFRAPVATEL